MPRPFTRRQALQNAAFLAALRQTGNARLAARRLGVNPSLEREGRVYINKTQSFDAVPPLAWTFPIGGYQPAQKWLKDRRGRTLSWEDIGHYQKIIKILVETDRIMNEIELPLSEGADA